MNKSFIAAFAVIAMLYPKLVEGSEVCDSNPVVQEEAYICPCPCIELTNDITSSYPLICEVPVVENMNYDAFELVPDSAQCRLASWENLVGLAHGVSVEDAKQIAAANPEITFFFWTKGCQLILENTNGNYSRFIYGDAVFFSGEATLGSAPDLADAYLCN